MKEVNARLIKLIKESKELILGLVLGGVIIQFFIQIFYWVGEYNPIIRTDFSPADTLNYWGGYLGNVLGAFVAISGVYITIKASQKQTETTIKSGNKTTRDLIENSKENIKESKRKSVLPVIVINRLKKKYPGNPLLKGKNINADIEDEEEIKEYEERNIEEFIFIITEDGISYKEDMPAEYEREIGNKYSINYSGNKISVGPQSFTYIPFVICNSGLGPAINTSFTLIKEESKVLGRSDALSFKINEDKKLIFLVEKSELCIGSYNFIIEYYNLYSDRYTQYHELSITEREINLDITINQKGPEDR